MSLKPFDASHIVLNVINGSNHYVNVQAVARSEHTYINTPT